MGGINFNREKTASRLLALEQYARASGISPSDFRCHWLRDCDSSLGANLQLRKENCGGLAHVGEEYDVFMNGQELRVLFVGKDYGRGNSEVRQRQTDIQTYLGEPNPHYKGIIKVLMEVFQERCDKNSWRYLLRRMAQTNATRCAAPRESAKGNSLRKSNITRTMRMNCWDHFKKEIEVLEPTLIWFHDADAQSSFIQAIRREGLSPTLPFEQLQECQQVEWTIFLTPFTSVLAFFHHPAFRHFGRQWGLATGVIARLRREGHLPAFSNEWKPLGKEEWPTL
ncbi:MAG: hypothetical protein ABSF92_00255 [Candidatus Acidiferrales bacterium]